ncbi:hypothetical protein CRUP_035657, partial [Coryphaenoides rupestris]
MPLAVSRATSWLPVSKMHRSTHMKLGNTFWHARRAGEIGTVSLRFAFGKELQDGPDVDAVRKHQSERSKEGLQGYMQELKGGLASTGVVEVDGPQEAHEEILLGQVSVVHRALLFSGCLAGKAQRLRNTSENNRKTSACRLVGEKPLSDTFFLTTLFCTSVPVRAVRTFWDPLSSFPHRRLMSNSSGSLSEISAVSRKAVNIRQRNLNKKIALVCSSPLDQRFWSFCKRRDLPMPASPELVQALQEPQALVAVVVELHLRVGVELVQLGLLPLGIGHDELGVLAQFMPQLLT